MLVISTCCFKTWHLGISELISKKYAARKRLNAQKKLGILF